MPVRTPTPETNSAGNAVPIATRDIETGQIPGRVKRRLRLVSRIGDLAPDEGVEGAQKNSPTVGAGTMHRAH